jgi:hypothetical protein
MYTGSFHAPPRMARVPPSISLLHHSLTLPAMSYTPNTPMPGFRPTGAGPGPEKFECGTMNSSLPAAACVQWWIVGRLLPLNRAKASASYQLTPRTGSSASPAG